MVVSYAISFERYGLIGILLLTALSYSIIPFPSEAAIIAAVAFFDPFLIILFALIGSTIGVLSSYLIGYMGIKRFYKDDSKWYKKAKNLFDKYGGLSVLMFGWLPLLGDPLMIVAGTLEMNILEFLIYSTIGRLIYFVIVTYLGVGIFGAMGV